jgi:chromosome segregation ATPase
MRYHGGASRLLLLSAFLSVGSLLWCQQASAPTPPSQSQEQTISQLKDGLTQALSLSLSLQQRLQLRIASFNQLQVDYNVLEAKLTLLQQILNDSAIALEKARSDLVTMQSLLSSLQESLKQASISLASYKSDTEKAVRAVEMQRNAWKIAGITFGVAAGAEAVYIVGHLFKAW